MEVIPKDKKDKAKAKILNSILDGWFKDNPGLEEDIIKLSSDIAFFNIKWGTKIKAEDLF